MKKQWAWCSGIPTSGSRKHDRNQHGSMRKFLIILRENITIHTRSPILSNNSPPAQYSRKMNCLSPDSSDLAP